jgi:glycosyltransferase involved in cell wall biosynthesis
VRQPDVSCIIPTRNRAGLVEDAIESALGQSHDSMEIIVVDDGSTDATSSVLASFSGRIRVLRTAGVGVAGARNAALAVARGSYIAFLDSDDVWYRDKTAVQVAFMDRHPEIGLSFADYALSERAADGNWQVVRTHRYEGEVSLRRFVERNFVGTLTVMVRRKVITELGGFDTSLERGSDYDLWLRIARRHALARVPHVLADYRWHEESLTGGSRRRGLETYAHVIERLAASDTELFALAAADPDALLAAARERIAELFREESSLCSDGRDPSS